jgi:hypothetical protein
MGLAADDADRSLEPPSEGFGEVVRNDAEGAQDFDHGAVAEGGDHFAGQLDGPAVFVSQFSILLVTGRRSDENVVGERKRT